MSSVRTPSPPHSAPIPIAGQSASHAYGHTRARSGSGSSSSDGGSPPPQTPVTPPAVGATLPRIVPAAGPGTSPQSPILSYFLNSATPASLKTPAGFPFRAAFAQSAVEEEERDESPMARHARRASVTASASPRFPTAVSGSLGEAQQQRGVGVLRRLSLSTPFGRPQMSPPSAAAPQAPMSDVANKPPSPRGLKRGSALGVPPASPTRRRAPSPMGERILKGHFDGFN